MGKVEVIRINDITITIEKKRIQNLYIRIMPPDGMVKVSAPVYASESDIYEFVVRHLEWIEKQREKYEEAVAPFQPLYESGETHFLWGRPYELQVLEKDAKGVISHKSKVILQGNKLIMQTTQNSTFEERKSAMDAFYRKTLSDAIPPVLYDCEKVVGRKALEWHIKDMKTKWGTCNIIDRRIWLNLQLAKKSPECLKYVVTHELVHLYEANHNKIFKSYMDRFYPGWRDVKKKLNTPQ